MGKSNRLILMRWMRGHYMWRKLFRWLRSNRISWKLCGKNWVPTMKILSRWISACELFSNKFEWVWMEIKIRLTLIILNLGIQYLTLGQPIYGYFCIIPIAWIIHKGFEMIWKTKLKLWSCKSKIKNKKSNLMRQRTIS